MRSSETSSAESKVSSLFASGIKHFEIMTDWFLLLLHLLKSEFAKRIKWDSDQLPSSFQTFYLPTFPQISLQHLLWKPFVSIAISWAPFLFQCLSLQNQTFDVHVAVEHNLNRTLGSSLNTLEDWNDGSHANFWVSAARRREGIKRKPVEHPCLFVPKDQQAANAKERFGIHNKQVVRPMQQPSLVSCDLMAFSEVP